VLHNEKRQSEAQDPFNAFAAFFLTIMPPARPTVTGVTNNYSFIESRYPDDSNIYVRNRRAGERVMESLTRFITAKLKLKVHQQKSAVARPWARNFLGFSFTSAALAKRRIGPKAVDRFQERIRDLTSRTRGVSMERMAEELSCYLRGWMGYFGKCETPSVLAGLEQWLRRRLQSAIWKQWKRGATRLPSCANGIWAKT
jgi:RNA-directed DNA polymerase